MRSANNSTYLKGLCHDIFHLFVFIRRPRLLPLIINVKLFRKWLLVNRATRLILFTLNALKAQACSSEVVKGDSHPPSPPSPREESPQRSWERCMRYYQPQLGEGGCLGVELRRTCLVRFSRKQKFSKIWNIVAKFSLPSFRETLVCYLFAKTNIHVKATLWTL